MDSYLRTIIEDAITAPSGENCQPWEFTVSGSVVDLFLRPERDQSLYSWEQRASYMANGALIENILISSKHKGYEPHISLFPDSANRNHIAHISFKKIDPSEDLLYPYLRERVTNRKQYIKKTLSEEQSSSITNCSDYKHGIKVILTTDVEKIQKLAKCGAVNEEVMMSNKHLHRFFFDHVNWTKQEDDNKKIGFFIDTLELPAPAKIGFKIFSNWSLARIFNSMGLSKSIGKQNSKIYESSGGMGIITMTKIDDDAFVRAGQVMQRVWLTTTKLGLSLQPLTGVLFFMFRINAMETSKFTDKQVKLIRTAYENIKKIFDLNDSSVITFMFRCGEGPKPTARSVRFSADDVITIVKK